MDDAWRMSGMTLSHTLVITLRGGNTSRIRFHTKSHLVDARGLYELYLVQNFAGRRSF